METNKVRSFSMYEVLEKPLMDFLTEGDGINALPVFEEAYFPDVDLVDVTYINLIRFISTAFGRCRLAQACKIWDRIHSENARKKILRFRSRHPLFTDGTSKYQNICLISGMVYLGIPILPYFDGRQVLDSDDSPSSYLELLRAENADLL